MQMVLATNNPAKKQRLRSLLDDLPGLELVERPALAVAEGADSLGDNAWRKAYAYAATYHLRSIATDGGLLVPALGSVWNPVLTGPRRDDLLPLMRDLHGEQRRAMQAECVVLADAAGHQVGSAEIVSAPRSVAERLTLAPAPDGFWLPGVLLYGPARKPFAELTDAERALADDHWLALRDRIRTLVVAELSRPA